MVGTLAQKPKLAEKSQEHAPRRWSKWRERRSRVEKDVRRTDRSQSFYRAERGRNVRMLRCILLSYSIYNYDLGYVQARPVGIPE